MNTLDIDDQLRTRIGHQAEILSFSASHGRLVIALGPIGDRVFLVLEDTSAIWGPVAWPNAQLEVVRAGPRDLLLRDSRAGFIVGCAAIWATKSESGLAGL